MSLDIPHLLTLVFDCLLDANIPAGENERIGKGARIRLIHTNDSWTLLDPGDEGTCIGVYTDDTHIQKIEVQWDSGSTLPLLCGVDDFIYWYPYQKRD